MEFIMINFETIKNVVTDIRTLIAFFFGAVVGVSVALYLIKFTDEKNENGYDRNKEIWKDQITNLKNEKSDFEKKLTICQNEKNNLEISIQKDYARKEVLNRCQQDYAEKFNQNQRINVEKINLLSQLQDKSACIRKEQHLQQQLDNIRQELNSGFQKGYGLHRLTEQERNERQTQQEQLVEQLNRINCYCQ